MKHIPHLVVGAPWEGDSIELSVIKWRHLTKVLHLKRGDPVTYTDGLGIVGSGKLGSQNVERGSEEEHPRPSDITVAVAPPANKHRQRFLVEKLTELGVARLRWLQTRHGKNRVANPSKVFSWILAATEQSRGAWLMEASPDLVDLDSLGAGWIVCSPEGGTDPGEARTVVIGPEGGFGPDELPEGAVGWSLGPTILRVETAAIVAATHMIGRR